jgi:TetR/AcrR family transcriptional repressor of nem operon
MCPRTAPPTQAELTERGRATRERILLAAAQLIHEHGVAGTSLDEVRAATGTSKSQLYHYFEDKAALVRAVVERQVQSVLQPGDELDRVTSLAGLRAWRHGVVAQSAARGCVSGCPLGRLTHELSDSDPASRAALVAGFAGWQQRLEAALTRIRDAGELPADADPAALAVGLLGAVQGGLLLASATGSTAPLAGALDLALAGITAQRAVG